MSGFLLDTNLPSESWRAQPAANVDAWLRSQVKTTQFISVVTVGELRKGAMLLPPGAKRTQIEYSALQHGLTVVTRNVKHFAGLGVTIFNPWEGA